jgi:hypothetical protein
MRGLINVTANSNFFKTPSVFYKAFANYDANYNIKLHIPFLINLKRLYSNKLQT